MPIVAVHHAPKEIADIINKIMIVAFVALVLRYAYHLLNKAIFLYRLKKLQKKYFSAQKMFDNGEIDNDKFNKILDEIADGFMKYESKGREFSDEFSDAIERIASDLKRKNI